tara:strand:- start:246 stop:1043 length:798 start_codon:yes stop_codon:yes gene_type:complete
MKKYLVIGNPIEHSLSPKLHNYWIKTNNIDAIYEKKKLNDEELESIIFKVKKNEIHGINVTVPFKNKIIPYIDQLSPEAEQTKSVNTIYISNNQIIGHNTDIAGFELSLKKLKYDVSGKKILILGAGGVVPSIIFALNRMNVSKITITNRTKENAEKLKELFKELTLANWGDVSDFDMIINATSVGLNTNEKIDLDLSKVGENKFFYDVIYNPSETNFLKMGKNLGNRTENGKFMFIYQAHQAFTIWHKLMPVINDEVINIVTND